MSLSRGGDSLGLSLTGMRIGPRDPATHAPKVGHKQEVLKQENSLSAYQARIMKERSGFSGGFKIPDEFRKSKIKKKGLLHDTEQEDEGHEGNLSANMITKDEIFQQLNLGAADSGIGVGKSGTNSKAALAKDLVDGIEKDLEKLRRQQENIQLRKHLALTGQSLVEETEDEKKRDLEHRLKTNLQDHGAHVIAASPKKLQVMRHQASQLGSIKNFTIENLEQQKAETQKRLNELQQIYNNKRENSGVGKVIRDRMGLSHQSNRSNSEASPRAPDFDRADDELPAKSGKRKKSVKIADGKENHDMNPTFGVNKPSPSNGVRFSASNLPPGHEFAPDNSIPISKKLGKNPSSSGLRSLKPNSILVGGQDRPSRSNSPSKSPISRGGGASRRHQAASSSSKRRESPVNVIESPRQKLYEAKFEKYLANKEQKVKQDKKLQKLQKEDFERYMQGPESVSQQAKRFSAKKDHSSKFEPDSLIPADYDQQLISQKQEEDRLKGPTAQYTTSKDPFKRLGVSNEDKMTFFLLKWIFNAIKRDSPLEDAKLLGKPFVTKLDLVRQLTKNDELMNALGYDSPEQVTGGVKKASSNKEGCFLWEEFLDFFFLRQAQLEDTTGFLSNEFNKARNALENNWWRKIGHSDSKDKKDAANNNEDTEKKVGESPNKAKGANVPRYGAANNNGQAAAHTPYNYEDPDKKPVKMTESLKMLQETRRGKVNEEVEEEFKAIHQQQKAATKSLAASSLPSGSKKKSVGWDGTTANGGDNDEDDPLHFGFKREKSELKLLQSQILIMQEIFEHLDKYNDGILRRSQYIMQLRTDERVVEFIDADAVKPPYQQRILTLDEVFMEIEKDEMFETASLGKQAGQINHKEFITWREFMGYFNDYKEVEERNKKAKEIQKTRVKMQNERKGGKEDSEDEGNQISSLMEKEKQRRLLELPKLRPADQIDISEKQLQLLKDVFDQQNKVPGKDGVIYTIDFFLATRKNPQLRAITSAIARDPEGYSRIPRETFQQVFDRMENELQSKELEWPSIVEYFTKRGRPLSKDDIARLVEEDRKQREDEEMKRRGEEEAERRRLARLMEDLDEDQDFEAFEGKKGGEEDNAAKKQLHFGGDHDDDYDHEDNHHDYGSEEHGSEDEDDDDDDNISREYNSDPEHHHHHQQPRRNANSQSRQRAQSAKGAQRGPFNEKDLRNSKLTTQDYLNHDKSGKKGKYGVTVPRPFNFDIREKSRAKTIRERKVEEMVNEKKNEEDKAVNHQFRSNPIPPEVLIPRYKTIMEGNMMRRMEVKKNSVAITKANERPFTFYEREKQKQKIDPEEYLPYDLKKPGFKANPIPRACSVLIFGQMMKKQEQERQERIRKQAETNFSKAKLPERMQMHSEKQKQMPPKRAENFDDFNFQPKINDLVTKEQFKKAQDKFNSKLQKKKAQQQVTRPKSPNFTKTSSKPLEREYLNEQDPSSAGGPMGDKFKMALMKKMQNGGNSVNNTSVNNAGEAAQNPSSTKSMTLAMQKRREQLEGKRKNDEDKAKEDQDRVDKQNRMKNTVQAALKDRIKDDTEKNQNKVEDMKKQQKRQEKEVKDKIQQAIERARSRPLLIDSIHSKKHSENLAKIRATKAFVEILKNQGLNPKDHLDDEQKELLAESDYIDKRKKELGK